MPGTLNIDRILRLLKEQRLEVATRSFEVHGSQAWNASNVRLDRINERIMRSPDDVPLSPTVVEPTRPAPPGPSVRARPLH